MLGSNLWVPQELGPRQMAGSLPPWPCLPWVGFLQTFKSPFATPSSGEFPRSDGSSSHWQWNASHLLQYNMIAITGFCCKKKKRERIIFSHVWNTVMGKNMLKFFLERKKNKWQHIYYHRILIINMHYKNNMPQFPHLSPEGGIEWQSSVTLCLFW